MADLHIDDFYRDAAKILIRLYRSFPQKIVLYVDEITGDDEPDEFGLHSPRFLAGFSAMVWLADEGFLRFDSPIKQQALDQAVLSERGFLLLSGRRELQTYDSVTVAEKVVDQLRGALKSGSSSVLEERISALLRL